LPIRTQGTEKMYYEIMKRFSRMRFFEWRNCHKVKRQKRLP
jgi:hypothetical protein